MVILRKKLTFLLISFSRKKNSAYLYVIFINGNIYTLL